MADLDSSTRNTDVCRASACKCYDMCPQAQQGFRYLALPLSLVQLLAPRSQLRSVKAEGQRLSLPQHTLRLETG